MTSPQDQPVADRGPSISTAGSRRLAAWGVHLFTASGAVLGLLMLQAIFERRWIVVFVWMGCAVAVDAVDGLFARLARVKELLPEFDGTLLDNIIDYLTYVVVPAVFLWHHPALLPAELAFPAAGAICLASAFQFCRADAKTEDHYFKGFPSYWNIVAAYLLLMGLDRWANLAIVLVLVVLIFVPIKYVYPSRTVRHRGLTLLLTAAWGVLLAAALARYPNHEAWLLWALLGYALFYVALSLYHMFNGTIVAVGERAE